MKRNYFPKTISILATPEEILQIERIKKFHHRKTTADMLRYLISKEDEKILSLNADNVANTPRTVAN